MFGLGFGEMVVIALLAIIVVGPQRLPTLLKTVGGAMRQLRQASRDIRTTVGFDELIDLDDRRPPRTPVARARPPVEGTQPANTAAATTTAAANAPPAISPASTAGATPQATQASADASAHSTSAKRDA